MDRHQKRDAGKVAYIKPMSYSSKKVFFWRQSLTLLAWLCVCVPPPVKADGVELIMIEQAGCHFCALFDEEIGQIYAITDEGKKAPLRRVNLHTTWPEDLKSIRVEPFTPTFILVDRGQEIDRLIGYPGDDYFWFLLNGMLDKLAGL